MRISWTLFWYVFKDLLRIFVLTGLALAGIMSFGGLLRPLTENGLDGSQVGKMLAYLLPAMTTYSLPIAALFATTMVYGRLSADNELTACRAAGISYLAVSLPALVLGLVAALTSLLFLCFVVPVFTFKVEKVVYANLANLVANKIERTHQIKFPSGSKSINIFARKAIVPPDLQKPGEQAVVLMGPMFVTYEPPLESDEGYLRYIPKDFYMARQATAYIRQRKPTSPVELEAVLDGGVVIPRTLKGGQHGGIQQAHFGPIPLPSPLREQSKFMNITRLKQLQRDPGLSQRINGYVQSFVRFDQEQAFLATVANGLRSAATPQFTFQAEDSAFVLSATGPIAPPVLKSGELLVNSRSPGRNLRLEQYLHGQRVSVDEMHDLKIRAHAEGEATADAEPADAEPDSRPDADAGTGPPRLAVHLDLVDALVQAGPNSAPHPNFPRDFTVAMPPAVTSLARSNDFRYYKSHAPNPKFVEDFVKIINDVVSEMHARASFAFSCFILVVTGCALGMMFKSGNFLSAFAVSVVPALVSITLIVTGQHTATAVRVISHLGSTNLKVIDPLHAGLALIWSGNAAVLLIALYLMRRLQRQ